MPDFASMAERWMLSTCLPKVYGERVQVTGAIDPRTARIRDMSDEELRRTIISELERLSRVYLAAPLSGLPAPCEERDWPTVQQPRRPPGSR